MVGKFPSLACCHSRNTTHRSRLHRFFHFHEMFTLSAQELALRGNQSRLTSEFRFSIIALFSSFLFLCNRSPSSSAFSYNPSDSPSYIFPLRLLSVNAHCLQQPSYSLLFRREPRFLLPVFETICCAIVIRWWVRQRGEYTNHMIVSAQIIKWRVHIPILISVYVVTWQSVIGNASVSSFTLYQR